MLATDHKSYLIVLLVLLQSVNLLSAPASPVVTTGDSVDTQPLSKDLTDALSKLEIIENTLLDAKNRNRKLMNVCFKMHKDKASVSLECARLDSENIVLREKISYRDMNPCPWAVLAGNITGKSMEKLQSVCAGVSCNSDVGKAGKSHSKKHRGLVPREAPLAPSDQALAISLTDVAFALQNAGKHQDAEPFFVWAVMIMNADTVGSHLPTATSLKNLAGLYLDMNEYKKAESAYRRAIAEYRYVLDEDSPKLALTQNMLAASLRGQKNYLEAEEMYLRSIATYESAYSSKHYRLVAPINNLAQLYLDRSRYKDASRWLNRAMAIVNHSKAAKPYRVYVEENMRRLEEAMVASEKDVAKIDLEEMKDEKEEQIY